MDIHEYKERHKRYTTRSLFDIYRAVCSDRYDPNNKEERKQREEILNALEELICGSGETKVETSIGSLIAARSNDAAAPGIALFFQKPGENEQTVIACAEVKEHPDYRTSDEKAGDISLYVYSDLHADGFTEKVIIPTFM